MLKFTPAYLNFIFPKPGNEHRQFFLSMFNSINQSTLHTFLLNLSQASFYNTLQGYHRSTLPPCWFFNYKKVSSELPLSTALGPLLCGLPLSCLASPAVWYRRGAIKFRQGPAAESRSGPSSASYSMFSVGATGVCWYLLCKWHALAPNYQFSWINELVV